MKKHYLYGIDKIQYYARMHRTWVVSLGDALAFWVTFFLVLLFRFREFSMAVVQAHLVPFAILFITFILVFFLFGLYDLLLIKPTVAHVKRFGIALSVCFGVGILLFYLVPLFGIAPKTNLLFQVVGFGFLSFLWRRRVFIALAKTMAEPAVVLGNSRYSTELQSVIESNPQLGLTLATRAREPIEALSVMRQKKNGIVIVESNDIQLRADDITTLYKNGTKIMDIATAYERFMGKVPVEYVSRSWIIDNIDPKRDSVSLFFVHLFDACVALSILIISSPVWVATAIAIYLYDQGPVFYTQVRTGLYGKPFTLFKFRSMGVDSEKNGAVWATQKDPRVTPIGRIIRTLHIDELPQMINIIRGDIALVGPRPERPEFVSELEQSISHYGLRHVIRPGFTGWAQVKFRYARTFADSKEKFEYDLYYIKNKNIFLDVGIIIRTLQIIFTH